MVDCNLSAKIHGGSSFQASNGAELGATSPASPVGKANDNGIYVKCLLYPAGNFAGSQQAAAS